MEDTNIIKLSYKEKVPVIMMKNIISQCVTEKLASDANPTVYEGDKCNEMAKSLADLIRNRLKDLEYDRYKFIVQVLIGERREQGIRMGSRCFWDSNTDNQATENFTNDHIFCVASAYAVYLY